MKSLLASFVSKLRTDARLRKRTIWAVGAAVALGVFAFDSIPPSTPAVGAPKPLASSGSLAVVSYSFIWVDVAGAVRHPGVYRLKPGDRLYSLIFTAGGFLRSADQASVNLARSLTDGEQVIVANRAQPGSAGVGPASTTGATRDSGVQKVNVNNADEAGLESLPGIGPTLGKRIADYRAKHGPFKSKADLMNVPGLGPKLVSGMSDLVAY